MLSPCLIIRCTVIWGILTQDILDVACTSVYNVGFIPLPVTYSVFSPLSLGPRGSC